MNNKDLKRLKICNTSNFKWKQNFYKLKLKLIERFGKKDGYDMQEIIHKCNCCTNGIYVNHSTGKEDLCHHCDGTGQFRIQYWKLNRFLINGELFHLPEYCTLNTMIKGYRFLIRGRIKHEAIKGNPYISYLILLYKYDKETFKKLIQGKLFQIKVRITNNLEQKCRIIKRYFQKETQDDLPF